MQAKLRQPRSAGQGADGATRCTARWRRTGRIWARATRSGRGRSLKLRELTAEELERIQRAKDRAAASDRAAAIAVSPPDARSRSGDASDPRRECLLGARRAAGAAGSASSSGPQAGTSRSTFQCARRPRCTPPRANARAGARGRIGARARVARPPPRRASAPRPSARPPRGPLRAARAGARAGGLSTSGRADAAPRRERHDRAHGRRHDRAVAARRSAAAAFFIQTGDAETMTFQNDDVSETFSDDAGLGTMTVSLVSRARPDRARSGLVAGGRG